MADDEKKGPRVGHDSLIEFHSRIAMEEQSDAGRAGERRQKIGAFAEGHSLESKALSQFRAGMKIREEGKQQDWIRTWKVLLPIAEQHILGNGTVPMDFDDTAGDSPADPEFDKMLAQTGVAEAAE